MKPWQNADRAFAKAQREYENRTPPEAEECEWHPWNEDTDGPRPAGPCPECESMREDYEADAYDRMKDDGLI